MNYSGSGHRWKISLLFLLNLIFMSSCNQTYGPEATLVLDTKSTLGEGALWHPEEQKLYWVDIEQFQLNIYDPVTGENKVVNTGQHIGTVVPIENENKVLVALKDGIYTLDPESGALYLVVSPEKGKANNRFNDGKCDPGGRFWAGTMAFDGSRGAGSLYRINHDGSARKILEHVSISNGIVWSSDNRTMYYIDTPTRQISAFDYDRETGNISNRRTAVSVPDEMGFPDGMTIDNRDKLWVAHWGGGCVAQWDPETGKLMKKIEVPAPHVTSCAFGGENLDLLFITTARSGLTKKQLEEYPLSGGLFIARPGAKGVPACFFKSAFSH